MMRTILDKRFLPGERLHLFDIDAFAQECKLELDGGKCVERLSTMLVLQIGLCLCIGCLVFNLGILCLNVFRLWDVSIRGVFRGWRWRRGCTRSGCIVP